MRDFFIEKSWNHIGFPCVQILVLHTELDGTGLGRGHRCGYVGVPVGHILYGRDYSSPDIDVHGGLTYSNKNAGYPDPDNKDNIWWFGFDCAHYNDTLESCDALYVELECLKLAEQLANYKENK